MNSQFQKPSTGSKGGRSSAGDPPYARTEKPGSPSAGASAKSDKGGFSPSSGSGASGNTLGAAAPLSGAVTVGGKPGVGPSFGSGDTGSKPGSGESFGKSGDIQFRRRHARQRRAEEFRRRGQDPARPAPRR